MKEYKVSQEQIEIQRKKQMIRSLPVVFITLVAGLYITFKNSGPTETYVLIPVLLIIAAAAFFGMKLGGKSVRNALSSYKIELSDNSIKYQANASAVEIQKSEVVQIIEVLNKGITIKTSKMHKSIGIPAFVDGYSEIRDSLSQWMNITVNEKSYIQLINIGTAVVVLAGFGTVILCKTSFIVVPVGIALTIGLIWSFIMIQKSPHLERKMKKSSFIIILPLISIMAKVLSFILR